MSSVSTVKGYDIDLCEDCSFISSHMQDGSDGQVYFFVGYTDGTSSYTGVNLTSGRITRDFDPIDEANAYRTGTGSSFVDRLWGSNGVLHDGDLLIFGQRQEPYRLELGLRLPGGFDWELGSIAATLLVNNDDMRLATVSRNGEWQGEVSGPGIPCVRQGRWTMVQVLIFPEVWDLFALSATG